MPDAAGRAEEPRASQTKSRVPADILDPSASVRTSRPETSKTSIRTTAGEPSVTRKPMLRFEPFPDDAEIRTPTNSGLMVAGAIAEPMSPQSVPSTYVFGYSEPAQWVPKPV